MVTKFENIFKFLFKNTHLVMRIHNYDNNLYENQNRTIPENLRLYIFVETMGNQKNLKIHNRIGMQIVKHSDGIIESNMLISEESLNNLRLYVMGEI